MKILICEDHDILLTALEFRMRKAGFEVIITKDGQEALDVLKTGTVDLMVADLEMPKVTGLEIIKHLREELKSDLPVIIIATLDQEEDIMKALEIGAVDFVAKPFKPAELVLRAKCAFKAAEVEE